MAEARTKTSPEKIRKRFCKDLLLLARKNMQKRFSGNMIHSKFP